MIWWSDHGFEALRWNKTHQAIIAPHQAGTIKHQLSKLSNWANWATHFDAMQNAMQPLSYMSCLVIYSVCLLRGSVQKLIIRSASKLCRSSASNPLITNVPPDYLSTLSKASCYILLGTQTNHIIILFSLKYDLLKKYNLN